MKEPITLKFAGIILLGFLISLASTTLADSEGEVQFKPHVGWYKITSDHFVLVTWGATGGLYVVDFEGLKQDKLEPVSQNEFLWHQGDDAPKKEVEFILDEGGGITGFRWNDDDGGSNLAVKTTDYGYLQEEVQFKNGETTLAGLLIIPHTDGPHPAAVFIHGSGDNDRNNLWAFSILNYLAQREIAVLLPDKRGSGKSGGDWRGADFNDLAGDSLAAVRLLKARDEIDASSVGLLGSSQGGAWIAPLAADISADVAFAINVSGSAVTPDVQVTHEVEQDLANSGWPKWLSGVTAPVTKFFIGQRWVKWPDVANFDPIPYWERLKVPVLVVYGEDDENDNVPVKESVARLKEAVQRSGHDDFTVVIYPGSGHGIRTPGTRQIRPDFLDLLVGWIKERSKG